MLQLIKINEKKFLKKNYFNKDDVLSVSGRIKSGSLLKKNFSFSRNNKEWLHRRKNMK